ncbi:uncharacterized protein BXIN_2859 [Babesia sp. Xinjiang]|uniref:uncharacterized protein n=1 Tax=Babesia sp. Xinjiang TaxID=462227 RepID=UPI000A226425|nr:uncharacterized protein BXIN_2859 [Babesia sp. Xinjiang]ORM39374.1 hypothetical protein BXIN_2859 [Babesia sp. Xinjiang]
MPSLGLKATVLFALFNVTALTTATGKHHQETDDYNYPNPRENSSTGELTYPYFNVHYHFNKYDWNKALDDQHRIIALRQRLAQIKRRINADHRRTKDFLNKQNAMLTDARANLFQRALYNTTKPRNARGFKKTPPDIHDRIHLLNDEYYEPIPASDFININEPYYFEMLANQLR